MEEEKDLLTELLSDEELNLLKQILTDREDVEILEYIINYSDNNHD